jgi:predicted RNA binding protein YcfA (HicA-like mRNA interferase family)
MSKIQKLLIKVLSGASDSNIEFSDLVNLLLYLGFENRVKGSHHIFFKEGVEEIINIQPFGSKAKTYQVRQVRNIILKYRLAESYE